MSTYAIRTSNDNYRVLGSYSSLLAILSLTTVKS